MNSDLANGLLTNLLKFNFDTSNRFDVGSPQANIVADPRRMLRLELLRKQDRIPVAERFINEPPAVCSASVPGRA